MKKIIEYGPLIIVCALIFAGISWWNSPGAQMQRALKHANWEAGAKTFNQSMEQSGKAFGKAWDAEIQKLRDQAHRDSVNRLLKEGWTFEQAENLAIPQ